jgi:SAM-dependent methyltransferase
MKARSLATYESLLFSGFSGNIGPFPPRFDDMLETLAANFGKVNVVDFGCGVGVALLSLVARAKALNLQVTGIGIDRGFKNSPDGVFPDSSGALQCIIQRYGSKILRSPAPVTRPPLSARFVRVNLDRDKWPLQFRSIHIGMSSKLVMYLSDKLLFLENVWRSLVVGGVAIIEVDKGWPGGAAGPTPRILLPAPLPELLAQQRMNGITVVGASWRNSYIVAMYRNTEAAMRLRMRLVRSEPFNPKIEGRDWGLISHYLSAQQLKCQTMRYASACSTRI